MEIVEKRADGTVEYKFVHNRMYQDVQRQFSVCVASMDPERMIALLQHNRRSQPIILGTYDANHVSSISHLNTAPGF